LEAHFSVVAGVGAAEPRLDRPLYSRAERTVGNQARTTSVKAYVSAIVVYSLFAVALVALILLVLLIAR
jgi:hypothetical protein